jgi:hypothetical protein
MALISLRAYARHRGCALRAVQKAIESGRISVVVDERGRKRIDPADADRRWRELTDPAKQRGQEPPAHSITYPDPEPEFEQDVEQEDPQAGDDPANGDFSGSEKALGEKPPNYMTSKALRESYLARRAKLDYLERAGELVEAKKIQIEWQKIVTRAKTKLLAVPSKVRARIPHMTAGDMATVEEEIREALEELAGEAGE